MKIELGTWIHRGVKKGERIQGKNTCSERLLVVGREGDDRLRREIDKRKVIKVEQRWEDDVQCQSNRNGNAGLQTS